MASVKETVVRKYQLVEAVREWNSRSTSDDDVLHWSDNAERCEVERTRFDRSIQLETVDLFCRSRYDLPMVLGSRLRE
jgi:hypothetical protein